MEKFEVNINCDADIKVEIEAESKEDAYNKAEELLRWRDRNNFYAKYGPGATFYNPRVAYKIKDHRYEIGGQDDEPWSEGVWFSCGFCDATIIDMDDGGEYVDRCPNCGKLIDWDGWK